MKRVTKKEDRLGTVIQWLLHCLVLSSPLIYLPIISDFADLPQKTFIQFFISLICLLQLIKAHLDRNRYFRYHPVMIPLAGWLLWSFATLTWSVDRYTDLALWLHWFFCSLVLIQILNTRGLSID